MRRSGLGRGLSSLLPDAEGGAGMAELPLDAIEPNPFQPRHAFDPERLAELAESVREHGLMQPVVVRPSPEGEGYQLVAGERRWRAARLAGLATVPAMIRPCTDRDLLEMALVENLQREDINPIEAAEAYQRCVDEFGLTQEELADRIGKSRSAVANTIRLLRLAAPIRAAIAEGRLSEGHGRALLALVDEEQQLAVARRVISDGLNVRETERLAREAQASPRRTRARATEPAALDPDLAAFEERLQRAFGTRVELRPQRDGGGTLVIHYYDVEDLHRIAEALE